MSNNPNTTNPTDDSNVVSLHTGFPNTRELSFAADLPNRNGRRCLWHVEATGDYGDDCATGSEMGVEYLKHQCRLLDHGGPSILQMIVADMPTNLTGVEIDFLTIVGHAAAAGGTRGKG